MKLELDRNHFLTGLRLVSGVPTGAFVPDTSWASNVLLEGSGDSLTLTATDLEIGARATLPAKVTKPGSIVLPAKRLLDIAKELPSAPVWLSANGAGGGQVQCGGAIFKLSGPEASDFPATVIPTPNSPAVTLKAEMLRDMLTQVVFAISTDPSRAAINGVLLEVGQNILCVATDGHRLAVSTRPPAEAATPMSGIIPTKAVKELVRVLGAGEEVQIALTKDAFFLTMPNFALHARLMAGQFPKWEGVVPEGHPVKVGVPREALTSVLRRVAVVADDRARPVKLTLSSETLTVSASTHEIGDAVDTLPVSYAGERVEVGFNSKYLLDALGALKTDAEVTLELKDGMSPGVFRGSDAFCVVMPMRI